MQLDEFLDRIGSIGAIARRDEAERAARAALATIAERLDEADSRALAANIPEPLAQTLRRARSHGVDFDVEELYRRVGKRERVRIGFAREHAQAVFEVVGRCLSDEARARLSRHLPSDMFALFEPVDRVPHAPDAPPSDLRHRDLASGKPGSAHPVSESAPPGAQQDSVARSKNPHADTKLSSARGLTQESLHETLAEGHPRRRPISEG